MICHFCKEAITSADKTFTSRSNCVVHVSCLIDEMPALLPNNNLTDATDDIRELIISEMNKMYGGGMIMQCVFCNQEMTDGTYTSKAGKVVHEKCLLNNLPAFPGHFFGITEEKLDLLIDKIIEANYNRRDHCGGGNPTAGS